MSMSNALDDLSREDLMKVIQRDRFVKEQMGARIGALTHENVELIGVIQELQGENQMLRQAAAEVVSHDLPDGQ